MVISYRRFGTNCQSHLQGSSSLRIFCPETSVRNYHSAPRKSPEERIPHLHRCEGLKLHTYENIQLRNFQFLLHRILRWGIIHALGKASLNTSSQGSSRYDNMKLHFRRYFTPVVILTLRCLCLRMVIL